MFKNQIFLGTASIVLTVICSLPPAPVRAACPQFWDFRNDFGVPEHPGYLNVNALTVWDDGTGPAVYVAGYFETIGGNSVRSIARWTGSTWSQVGDGFLGLGGVNTFGVYGGSLIAGGSFTTTAGNPVVSLNGIARWDGSRWWPLGPAQGVPGVGLVYTMVEYHGALFVAGNTYTGIPFTPTPKRGVFIWTGTWTDSGITINSDIGSLAVYQDKLIAAGSMTYLNGLQVNHVAQWDGGTWSTMGSGFGDDMTQSVSVAVENGKLVARGSHLFPSGNYVPNVAVWNGTDWVSTTDEFMRYAVRTTLNARPVSLGNGSIFAWNGTNWSQVGDAGVAPCGVVAYQGQLLTAGYLRTSRNGYDEYGSWALHGALDVDQDGVCDDVDQCPSTPAGKLVDTNGCSLSDTDNDGVQDVNDACPNTPPGATIGNDGCADAERDSDNDGVPDIRDVCANTAAGASVNASGCSLAQDDLDGDGVRDEQDACRGTPPGASVDANGCAADQLDSDGDGTPDLQDGCPNDIAKTHPGTCGCGQPDWDGCNSSGPPPAASLCGSGAVGSLAGAMVGLSMLSLVAFRHQPRRR
ncbi:MAG TPA: thrombospondin type 3 repeat-containing protein [Phycisphaerae bacterium]|nr:thrombospondin type 3 repeat-containing protein [Phycisphaerae bacterium]HRY70904.1 thrombospondin type 3 repeat-containing protein [Phycisphaerae bacterium]HSA29401.1 thrombospondin type 3 repeat-containing protein [Phycisphaerae bacterium]